MSETLLQALGNHLTASRGDGSLFKAVSGEIHVVKPMNRAALPLVMAWEEDPRSELFRSNGTGCRTDWSLVHFAIVVDIYRNPNGKQLAESLRDLLMSFLDLYPQFSASGYDRGLCWPLSVGTERIETYEQAQIVILDPLYQMTGTRWSMPYPQPPVNLGA